MTTKVFQDRKSYFCPIPHLSLSVCSFKDHNKDNDKKEMHLCSLTKLVQSTLTIRNEITYFTLYLLYAAEP